MIKKKKKVTWNSFILSPRYENGVETQLWLVLALSCRVSLIFAKYTEQK